MQLPPRVEEGGASWVLGGNGRCGAESRIGDAG